MASMPVLLAEVRARLSAAAVRSGRAPEDVTLVAVVKTLPPEVVAEAVRLGIADLGENRVQEAQVHQQLVPRDAARWHFIGHLQRNKAGKVPGLFDVVHSVDDLELATALARRAAEAGRTLPVLVEVNVSGEASKFGVSPEALPELLEGMAAISHLELRGLMTVPAVADRPEEARAGFAMLRELRDRGAARIGRALPELSMGMSGDFEVAIEEGATLVRVGSALFGARQG
ncbi:MAG: YggS family pyridoxal phosphate-dependent enzyme [Candidatus Eisenbacteria bacterium]|nr:YggS family pyridoxal phosphate-dependent enzyme [Candidatus Eisenbacteria bacterium]